MRTAFGAWIILGTAASLAAAQTNADRPSATARPSQNVGAVGGDSTRYASSTASLRTRSTLSSMSGGVASLGLSNSAVSPTPRPAAIPAAFSFIPSGVASSTGTFDYFAYRARVGNSSGELMDIAGLDRYFSNSAPLIDMPRPEVRVTALPDLPRVDERSSYEKFFNFQPVFESQKVSWEAEGRTYIDLLEDESLARRPPIRTAALDAFKDGTRSENERAAESLSHAMDLMENSLRLSPDDLELRMLLVQGRLESNHTESAFQVLLDAVRRKPELFTTECGFAALYGEPRRLTETARRYLFVEQAPGVQPAAYAIQGYAAWIVRDAARMRQAADALQSVGSGSQPIPAYEMLARCLRAGAQTLE